MLGSDVSCFSSSRPGIVFCNLLGIRSMSVPSDDICHFIASTNSIKNVWFYQMNAGMDEREEKLMLFWNQFIFIAKSDSQAASISYIWSENLCGIIRPTKYFSVTRPKKKHLFSILSAVFVSHSEISALQPVISPTKIKINKFSDANSRTEKMKSTRKSIKQ